MTIDWQEFDDSEVDPDYDPSDDDFNVESIELPPISDCCGEETLITEGELICKGCQKICNPGH